MTCIYQGKIALQCRFQFPKRNDAQSPVNFHGENAIIFAKKNIDRIHFIVRAKLSKFLFHIKSYDVRNIRCCVMFL